MKKFKIVYWAGLCEIEIHIRADNRQKALERFRDLKGDKRIISIEDYTSY